MTETYIVENSSSPGAIGDTIAAFPALQAIAWRADKPISVYLASKPCRKLLSHPKIVVLEDRPASGHLLNIQAFAAKYMNTGQSMSQAYMAEVGLQDVAAVRVPELEINTDYDFQEPFKSYNVLLAPFSHSDYGTNTKTWADDKWRDLVWYLQGSKKARFSVGLLGTEKDITGMWETMPVDRILGLELAYVAGLISCANLTISVDNGINWITQAVKAPHLCFLPPTAHPGWTANRNPNAINMPVAVSAIDAITQIKKILGDN